jgi:hypothetical protein
VGVFKPRREHWRVEPFNFRSPMRTHSNQFVKSESSAKALDHRRFQASTVPVSTCVIPFSCCSGLGGVTICVDAYDETKHATAAEKGGHVSSLLLINYSLSFSI